MMLDKWMRWLMYAALMQPLIGQTALHEEIANCNRAIKQGDMEKAVVLSDEIIKQSPKDFEGLICQGRALSGLERYEAAINSFKSAQQSTNDPFQQVVAMSLVAGAQKNSGRLSEALIDYQAVLEASRRNNIKRYERIAHNMMGEIQLAQDKPEDALQHYLQGEKLAANHNERADNYARIANAYRTQAKYQTAIEYQLKAKLTEQSHGEPENRAQAMLILGQLYTENKEYSRAEEAYQELLRFCQENGGEHFEAKTWIALAQLALKSGDKQKFEKSLSEAERIIKKIQADDLLPEAAKLRATTG